MRKGYLQYWMSAAGNVLADKSAPVTNKLKTSTPSLQFFQPLQQQYHCLKRQTGHRIARLLKVVKVERK